MILYPRHLAAALLALSLAAGPAVASHKGHMKADQLYRLCTQNIGSGGSRLEAGECLGYIVGIADSFDCEEVSHGHRWNSDGANDSQMTMVVTVLQYLDEHPPAMNEDAHRVVAAALENAFPCK